MSDNDSLYSQDEDHDLDTRLSPSGTNDGSDTESQAADGFQEHGDSLLFGTESDSSSHCENSDSEPLVLEPELQHIKGESPPPRDRMI